MLPAGTYRVDGHDIGAAEHLPIVRLFGENETWVAFAVLALISAAMVVHLVRTLLIRALFEVPVSGVQQPP